MPIMPDKTPAGELDHAAHRQMAFKHPHQGTQRGHDRGEHRWGQQDADAQDGQHRLHGEHDTTEQQHTERARTLPAAVGHSADQNAEGKHTEQDEKRDGEGVYAGDAVSGGYAAQCGACRPNDPCRDDGEGDAIEAAEHTEQHLQLFQQSNSLHS